MKEKIFIDTNAFLHLLTDGENAAKIDNIIKSEGYSLFTNFLVLNELIYKLLWISASELLKTNRKFVLLEHIKNDAKLREEVYSKFTDFYTYLKNECTIVGFQEEECLLSLSISKKFGLLPTDASIVASMASSNIKKILTDDSDFKKIKLIEVIEV